MVIESPARAVGQHAPAEASGREIVHTPQIAEHLSRRCKPLTPASGSAVEGSKPALGLDYGESEFVTPPFLGEAVGAVLGRIVSEQQSVGNVIATTKGEVLLAKARGPAEAMQDGPDQIVLRLALIRGIRGREAIEQQPDRGFEGVERRIVERQPIGRLDDGLSEKIA